MKTQFKNPINNFGLIVLMLMSMFIFGFGCNSSKPAPDPLAGWKSLGFESPNKVITDDYQDYIQQHNMKGYAGPIQFFEDAAGQHAVEFEAFEHDKNASWHYVLIYDKENKRLKVIKYEYAKYQS
jgi:hypothetical protein